MSFFIITTSKKGFTWNYPEPKPKFPEVDPAEMIIDFLQADGHELQQIINRFMNVPSTYGICMWRGAMAQFIYDNL